MRGARFAMTAALWLAICWLACVAYSARFIYRGWIAHDEGTIAQSAERVLHGELPHRDFDEVYTGGLTYLHAFAMKIFGINLRAPRLLLFGFFVAFLAAIAAIAQRIASSITASLTVVLATVWSVPNYFASLPSWYVLFFTAFGVLAFMKFLEGGHRRWLVTAGLCGGCAVLAKITGAGFLIGGLLFLAYLNRAPRLALAVPAAACIAVLFYLGRTTSGTPELLSLFLPFLTVSSFLAWHAWRVSRGAFPSRATRWFSPIWPFVLGAAVPLMIFAGWYALHGALPELTRGVFVLPQRRLAEASLNPPRIASFGLAIPYLVLLVAGWRREIRHDRIIAAILAAGLGALLAFANNPIVYRAIWGLVRSLPTVAALAGVWLLSRSTLSDDPDTYETTANARLFLFLIMAGVVALLQFPYATPTYFCYVAPMTLLGLVAVISRLPFAPKAIHVVVAIFFAAFAVLFVNRSYGWNLGVAFIPYDPHARLDLDRGGLYVPDDDKRTYEDLVRVVRRRAAGGTILAGPDCPEVYFLSGFQNPTRAIFDFLTPVREDAAWISTLLDTAPIKAVVINEAPLFSPRFAAPVLSVIEGRFPSLERVGRFVIRFN